MMKRRSFLKSLLLGAASFAIANNVDRTVHGVVTAATGSTGSTLRLSRIYRFVDPATGAPQISAFPDEDDPPTGDTPLEVRMKHFTEIENFTFLAYILAHELGSTEARPLSRLVGLSVPDAEFQMLVDAAQSDLLTDEELGDTVLDIGINWEHFVASTDTLMIEADPLKITDEAMQAKIDSLDLITEALVDEVNARSVARRSITLNVTTLAGNGAPITGYFVSVQQDGAELTSGFSPVSFALGPQVYQVAVEDFGDEVFSRWQDGSTDRLFPLDLSTTAPGSTVYLTAVYSP